jgi:hypothetical protein
VSELPARDVNHQGVSALLALLATHVRRAGYLCYPHPATRLLTPSARHCRPQHKTNAAGTIHIYNDLLNHGDGTGEGLVAAYYETVGWPSFLPTAEQVRATAPPPTCEPSCACG